MNAAKALKTGARASRRSKRIPGMKDACRQMGIDPGEFGDQAKEIWSMLNDMAQNDPEKYQEFLSKQMEESKRPPRRGFEPRPGFSFKTSVKRTNDAVRVNVCAFDKIEAPTNAKGESVIGKPHHGGTNGLNIPLAIGKTRKKKSNCVLDVIVHPWVTEQCGRDEGFRYQVIELVLSWAEKEVHASLSRRYAVSAKPYVAHDCILPNVPVFFEIDGGDASSPQDDRAAPSVSGSIKSPSELLKQMQLNKEQDETPMDGLRLEKESADVADAKKNNLITEVGKGAKQKRGRKKPAVKAGFLHSRKAKENPLYPTGSNEGAPKTFMDRAKIVDLNKMSEEEARAAVEAHAKGEPQNCAPKQPPRPPQRNYSAIEKLMEENPLPEFEDEFERAVRSADKELAASSVIDSAASLQSNSDLFAQLSKYTLPGGSEHVPSPPAKPIIKANDPIAPPYTIAQKIKGGKKVIQVSILFEGQESLPAGVELDVSKTKVKLTGGGYSLDVPFPCKVLPEYVGAKFRKKRAALVVTAEVAAP